MVALERLFAATPRGAALINRIKADPALGDTEIRVIAHDSDYSRRPRACARRQSRGRPDDEPPIRRRSISAARGARRASRSAEDVRRHCSTATPRRSSTSRRSARRSCRRCMLKPNQVVRMALERRARQPAVQRGRGVGVVRNPAEQRAALPRRHRSSMRRATSGARRTDSAGGTRHERLSACSLPSCIRDVVPDDRVVALGAGRDDGRLDARHLFEPRDVAPRGVRQIGRSGGRPCVGAVQPGIDSYTGLHAASCARSDGNSVSVRAPHVYAVQMSMRSRPSSTSSLVSASASRPLMRDA